MKVRLHGGPWWLPPATPTEAPTQSAADESLPAGRCWVLLDVGSKQSFIFASNRRRASTGASSLIGEHFIAWVKDACAAQQAAGHSMDTVVLVSGKAVLLVDDPEVGRSIVSAVTERALREAPGLDVWGALHEIADDDFGGSLRAAHATSTRARLTRPAPAAVFMRTPFTQPCALTGAAAAMVVRGPERSQLALSAQMNACLQAESSAFKDWPGVQRDLKEDLAEGWVAVVHADGNGFGAVFSRLPEDYPDGRFVSQYRQLSAAVDEVTKNAVRKTADAMAAELAEQGVDSDWWLPLIVAGDDVTFMIDGRHARRFTELLLTEFAAAANGNGVIARAFAGVAATMSAGIAYVKPHFPFSQAYKLAEELCSAAKSPSGSADEHGGTFDYLVLHDSVARSLDTLRREDEFDDPEGLVDLVDSGRGRHDSARDLDYLMSRLRSVDEGAESEPGADGAVSSALAHEVRFALAKRNTKRLVKSWSNLPSSLKPFVINGDGVTHTTSWIDAMTLNDVERS